MAGISTMNRDIAQRYCFQLSFLGFVCWCMALPFSQVQHTRFTSIAIFIVLGAFLISWVLGFRPRWPSKSFFFGFWPLATLSILPLLDYWRWQFPGLATQQLVTQAPMLVLPGLIALVSPQWPRFWVRISVLVFATSLLVNMLLSLSLGPGYVWNTIRSEQSDSLDLWLERPYYGIMIGALLFLLPVVTKPIQRKFLTVGELFFGVAGVCFLILILAKMAILALVISAAITGLGYCFFFRNGWRWRVGCLLSGILMALVLAFRLGQTDFWSQLSSGSEISYSTLNRLYSNSFNTRIIIWKSAICLLSENNHWVFGLGTANAQPYLDAYYQKINFHVFDHHFNPHNQFISKWLEYGVFGFFTMLMCFAYPVWKSLIGRQWWFVALWIFLFFCSCTEVLTNRETGCQLLAWVWIVWYFAPIDSKNHR